MPARKKQRTDPKDLKRSRRRKDEDTGSDDGDNFFLEVEDEIAEDKGAESDKEPQETAEEKRLRLGMPRQVSLMIKATSSSAPERPSTSMAFCLMCVFKSRLCLQRRHT